MRSFGVGQFSIRFDFLVTTYQKTKSRTARPPWSGPTGRDTVCCSISAQRSGSHSNGGITIIMVSVWSCIINGLISESFQPPFWLVYTSRSQFADAYLIVIHWSSTSSRVVTAFSHFIWVEGQPRLNIKRNWSYYPWTGMFYLVKHWPCTTLHCQSL